MKDYKQVNYKLPASVVEALSAKAKAENTSATRLVLRGLAAIGIGAEPEQEEGIEHNLYNQLKSIEERLQQLDYRNIENELYQRIENLELLLEAVNNRLLNLENTKNQIDDTEKTPDRIVNQIERLEKITARNTGEIQGLEQRLYLRLIALEKRTKILEEKPIQAETEQLEAQFEEEAPLIKLFQDLQSQNEENTSEISITSQENYEEVPDSSQPKNIQTLVPENRELTHEEISSLTGISLIALRTRHSRKQEVSHNGVNYKPTGEKGKPKWVLSKHSLEADPTHNLEVEEFSSDYLEATESSPKTHNELSDLTGMNIETIRTRHRNQSSITWKNLKFIPVRVDNKPRWREETKTTS